MSWGGVQAIPLQPGETRSEAVDRVYAGGLEITLTDGVPSVEQLPGGIEEVGAVSRTERAWMLEAVQVLKDLRPEWTVVEELKGDGRRWPWWISLDDLMSTMAVDVTTTSVTLRWTGLPVDDLEWRFWWRTIRRLAAWPAAIFHPDKSELISTSMSARAARDRYNWL